jgi:Lon protease-like protein
MRRASCVLFVIVLLAGPAALAAAPHVKSFKMPTLWCTADGAASGLSRVEFSLTREPGSRKSLTVAIAEDTPSGTGDSLRASVWQACMVAALTRNDDLSGVKLSLTIRGRVDGPSAGAVICLAVLTALDGRDFPADTAMTGTVLPDGTVGRVGGIPHKIKAASRRGVKRVILPAFLRFDRDLATGKDIDLKELAKSLKIEFVQVDDIEDAYAILHRLPRKKPLPLDSRTIELPQAIEKNLLGQYRKDIDAGEKIAARMAKVEQNTVAVRGLPVDRITRGLMSGELGQVMFKSPRGFAEAALRSGKFLPAQSQAKFWAMSLKALQKEGSLLEQAAAKPGDKTSIKALTKRTRDLVNGLPSPIALIAKAHVMKVPDAGCQLFSQMSDYIQVLGVMRFLDKSAAAAKAQAAMTDNKEFKKAIEAQVVKMKSMQLLLAALLSDYMKGYVENNARQARLLPKAKFTGRPRTVERLFYSAWLTAHNTLEKGFIGAAAKAWGCTTDQAWWSIMQNDQSIAGYSPAARLTQDLHGKTLGGGTPPFVTAVAAQSHLNAFADASGIVVRFMELDARLVEGKGLRYGRTDLLSHLLATARNKAIASIMKCKKLGIPCVTPIAYLQYGDMTRDDPDSDKVAVLVSYWKASLQAKALIMLFGKP